MGNKSIENRLKCLEEQVRDIHGVLTNGQRDHPGVKDWRKSLGMFDDDSLMKQIDNEGQNIRQHEREKVGDDHS